MEKFEKQVLKLFSVSGISDDYLHNQLIINTMKKYKFLFLLLGFLFSANLFAQQNVTEEIAMADQLRADGKIWVVVAVISIIFAGIILFLINMERKVSKLEKQLKK